jgi:hypothetical protein
MNPYNNPSYDPNDPTTWFNVDASGKPVPPPLTPTTSASPSGAKTGPVSAAGPQTMVAPVGVPGAMGTTSNKGEGQYNVPRPGGAGGIIEQGVDGALNPVAIPDTITGGRIEKGAGAAAEETGLTGLARGIAEGGGDLGAVRRMLGLGGGDDGKSAQTALAQQTVAPTNANAQELYDQALVQANIARTAQNAPQVVSQQIDAPAAINARGYDSSTPIATIERTAQNVQGYDATKAVTFDSAGRQQQAAVTQAQQTAPATVGTINTSVSAPQLGSAAQTGPVGVGRVQVSGLADSMRTDQIAAAKKIADGPSAAMSQFKAGQAQTVSDQLSMAAQARGSQRAGLRREAIIAAGQQGLVAGLSAAALAAKEEQDKRVASSTALGQIRSQDVTSATSAASIAAEQANLQAQIDAAIAQGNTKEVNALLQRQGELTLEARKAELSGGLTQQGTQAELERSNLAARQEVNLYNTGAQNKAQGDWAAIYNTAVGNDYAAKNAASGMNAAADTKASADLAASRNAAIATDAAASTGASQYNTGLAAQIDAANKERQLKIDEGNRAADMAAQTTNASNTLEADKTTSANAITVQGQRIGGATDAINAGTSATGVRAKSDQTVVDADKAGSAADTQKDSAIIGAVGAGLAASSDVRAKEDISRVGGGSSGGDWAESYQPSDEDDEATKRQVDRMSDDQIQDWAEKAADLPITFRYKPGIEDGGKDVHLGFPAQGLEKSGPLGKLMVRRGRDGMRVVDYGAATLMLAKAGFDRANKAFIEAKGRR